MTNEGETSASTPNQGSLMSQLKVLKTKRAQIKGALTRAKKFADEELVTDELQWHDFASRLGKVEEGWTQYADIQQQIITNGTEDAADTDLDYVEFEKKYHSTVAIMHCKMRRYQEIQRPTSMPLSPPLTAPPPVTNTNATLASDQHSGARWAKLPPLHLDTFSGELGQWNGFKQTFNAVIDSNPRISTLEKYQYLRSVLRGPAKQLIDALPLTAEYYASACEMLRERYENKRILLHQVVKSMFDYPKINRESSKAITSLLDHFRTQLEICKSTHVDTASWDLILVYLVTQKLDASTLRAWERQIDSSEPSTYHDLCVFLERRSQMLAATTSAAPRTTPPSGSAAPKPRGRLFMVNGSATCPLCHQQHRTFQCTLYKEAEPGKRLELAKRHNLCWNCLQPRHSSRNCTSPHVCRTCSRRHHTSLHAALTTNMATPAPRVPPNRTEAAGAAPSRRVTEEVINALDAGQTTQALLSTVMVYATTAVGTLMPARCLLDSGSTHSFVTKDFCKRLRLKTKATSVSVSTANAHTMKAVELASIHFTDAYAGGYEKRINCLVLESISQQIPSKGVDVSQIDIPPGVQMADPNFDVPAPIDVLLASDVFWEILTGKSIRLSNTTDGPALHETLLGWILVGRVPARSNPPARCHLALSKQIEKFWEIENVSANTQSEEDRLCEEIYARTTVRLPTGRYQVALPQKQPPVELGYSKLQALKRFYTMERKLYADPVLKQQYFDFMEEYEKLGHMKKLTSDFNKDGGSVYYLPHHPVFKVDRESKKIRVVFDASAKTSNGNSLNCTQMAGPTLQDTLYQQLLHFRQHDVVLTTDCTKMYRQVLLTPEHRDLQRILWRKTTEEAPQVYQLQTVTYGLKASSFLAIRTLHQLANDEERNFPMAAAALRKNLYVDDALLGATGEREAVSLYKQLTQLTARGGFTLAKWCSNSEDVLQQIRPEERAATSLQELGDAETLKTLGLYWHPKRDELQYTVQQRELSTTKRQILSDIARLFDPLHLLGPVIVAAKLIMQRIWKSATGWDEPVPHDILQDWSAFYQSLPALSELRIPRQAVVRSSHRSQLHIFCDASQSAYGACAYIRSQHDSLIHVSLLTAKSKVAPLKVLTLPRLELCAAVLACELYQQIIYAVSLQFEAVWFYTDSTTVLAWLSREPGTWTTFVSHRVAFVQQTTNGHKWLHVRSSQNPADVLSRGIQPDLLRQHELWWTGPDFVHRSHDERTPVSDIKLPDDMPEMRRSRTAPALCDEREAEFNAATTTAADILQKFSSFVLLTRIIAWCFRFVNHCRKKGTNDATHPPEADNGRLLRVSELEHATAAIFKMVQKEAFPMELKQLLDGKPVHKKSPLLTLNPFLSQDGLIRVGGRLQKSEAPFTTRHPILLPGQHHVTRLLIRREHLRNLHLGAQALLYVVRQNYWPLHGLRTVKAAIRSCKVCFAFKPTPASQIMGNLPSHRVTHKFPFHATGIDYAGPVSIKPGLVRSKLTVKCYLALFLCLATKCIHLELVTALSTAAFIAALKRFIARRGRPAHIYSDNATNFVGANRELQDMKRQVEQLETSAAVVNFSTGEGIQWHFLPPHSPNWGGIWERGVRSVKSHLYKTTRNCTYTYEELSTLLCSIEAILNSRPLTPISSDPDDLMPLTPGHFLIGRPVTSVDEPSLADIPANRLSRWQFLEEQRRQFWVRWTQEYLTTLQPRPCWTTTAPNLGVGRLVILRELNAPPLVWPLARVVDVITGPDGRVRAAHVRTAKGTFLRNIRDLHPLPDEEMTASQESTGSGQAQATCSTYTHLCPLPPPNMCDLQKITEPTHTFLSSYAQVTPSTQ